MEKDMNPTVKGRAPIPKSRRAKIAKVLFYLFYSLGVGILALIYIAAITSGAQPGAGMGIVILMILLVPVGAILIVIALLIWLWAFRLGAVKIDLWNIVLLVLGIVLLFLLFYIFLIGRLN